MILPVVLLFMGCHAQPPGATQLPYDMNRPDEVIALPEEIHDLSGIAYDATSKTVFAIDDDQGKVFQIPLRQNPAIQSWTIGKPEDYEDIVLTGNMLYVLASEGKILYLPLSLPLGKPTPVRLPVKGKNDFETLFKDPRSERLLMVCKQCADDSKKKSSVYAFDLNQKDFQSDPVALIDGREVSRVLGSDIKNLKPAAAAAHPETGEIYLLASVNKLMLILNAGLEVQSAYKLDPRIFKQPEGIAFTPAGDLLISNEAGKTGKANILIFKKR